MANGFYVEGSSLYGNTDKTVGPTLPLGVNGGVVVGADADTVLTTSSGRRLLITPTANRNYTLPTGALELLGDTWQFMNLATSFSVTLKASDASTIVVVQPGRTVEIFAKQDNPTTNTHWATIANSAPEYLENKILVPTALGALTVFDVNTLSVPAGTWNIKFSGSYLVAATGGLFEWGISLTSATFTGNVGIEYFSRVPNFPQEEPMSTIYLRKTFATTTTVYGIVYNGNNVGDTVTSSVITAERVSS